MCCRVVLSDQDEKSFRDSIVEEFDVKDDTQLELTYSHNIAPGSILPIVYKDVVIKASSMKWGLIPFSGDLRYKSSFPNTRIETADIKISFRDSFLKRRCIIPVSGYYEWKDENGIKQPYYFYSNDNKHLALAGLYNRTRKTINDPYIYTFTILTQPARGKLASIHERMPVILPRSEWKSWLDDKINKDTKERIVKESIEDISFYKVSTKVNNVRNDSKTLIEKI